jgi:hypothetical protein
VSAIGMTQRIKDRHARAEPGIQSADMVGKSITAPVLDRPLSRTMTAASGKSK